MNGAYYAYNDWVRTTRDPRASYTDKLQAFNHYTESLNMIQSRGLVRKADFNRQTSWLAAEDDMERIIQQRLGTLPANREPTRREVETALQRIEDDLTDYLEGEFEGLAEDVYRDAMEDTAEEISGFTPQFGGRHQQALDALLDRRTVPDTFQSISEEATTALMNRLDDAYAEGTVDPIRIAQEVFQESGHDVYGKIELVSRTEAFKIWSRAKRETYKEAEERRGVEFQYEFIRNLGKTPRGNPQCDVCTEIIKRTKGGVSWDDLVDIIVDVSSDPAYGGSPKWDAIRDGRENPTPHPGCRHTASRVQE